MRDKKYNRQSWKPWTGMWIFSTHFSTMKLLLAVQSQKHAL